MSQNNRAGAQGGLRRLEVWGRVNYLVRRKEPQTNKTVTVSNSRRLPYFGGCPHKKFGYGKFK